MRINRLFFIFCLSFIFVFGSAAYGADADRQNGRQNIAKEVVLSAITNYEAEVNLEEYGLTPDELYEVYVYCTCLSSSAYCVDKNYTYNINEEGTVTVLHLSYIFSPEETEYLNSEIEKVIGRITALTERQTNSEKVETVYNYFCDNYSYLYDSEHNNIYGAFITKKSACLGWAQAFKTVMDRLDIPCRIELSYTKNHAWNKVCVDNEWYNIDLTRTNRPYLMNDLFAAVLSVPVFYK